MTTIELACAGQLRTSISQRLSSFELSPPLPATAGSTFLRRAAVCVAIIEEGHGANLAHLPIHEKWSTQAALLLTRRAGHMRSHAGQWALPGGRIDASETPEEAALRELQEEVGLRLDEHHILGRLDDFVTRSGYQITPVVVWAGSAHDLSPNEAEVASIHRISMLEFLRADAPMLAVEAHSSQQVLRMPVGNSWIAAPTAAILYQFREVCLLDRVTRVAHFEQPHFAWK